MNGALPTDDRNRARMAKVVYDTQKEKKEDPGDSLENNHAETAARTTKIAPNATKRNAEADWTLEFDT